MDRFPVFLDLHHRQCLVVGGGKVAERKVDSLIKAGAIVTLVSPFITAEMAITISGNKVKHYTRLFEDSDIDGQFLVVAATNSPNVNARIARMAEERNMLVNVVDDATVGNFIIPSVVDRSPVMIAVSTGGASPVLARQLRMRLETMIPPQCGELAGITEEYRDIVKKHLPEAQRKTFWEKALKGPFAELVYAGHVEDARRLLDEDARQLPRWANDGRSLFSRRRPRRPRFVDLQSLALNATSRCNGLRPPRIQVDFGHGKPTR